MTGRGGGGRGGFDGRGGGKKRDWRESGSNVHLEGEDWSAPKEKNYKEPTNEEKRVPVLDQDFCNRTHEYTAFDSRFVKAMLGNVKVLTIGDSLMRGLYKDLITWIQSDHLSTDNELKARAETNFKGDRQIDISLLSDDKVFRQAREYQTDTHLIQFLFTTRIMKDDMELLIQQMLGEDGYPDVILINSMIWDLTRYFKVATDMSYSDSAYQKKIDIECIQKYLDRTSMFLRRLRAILPPHTMVVWVCFPHCRPSLPPSEGRRGRGIQRVMLVEFNSFQNTPLAKERNHFIRSVMIDGNFRIAQVVKSAGYDVLDLGFYMRNHAFYHYQKEDGMHWLPAGVRLMSQLLIQFLAKSWGIDTSQYFRRLEEKQSRRAVCAAKDQLQNYEFYTKDLPRISDDIAELAFENLSLSKKYTFNNVVEKGRTIAPFVQPTIRSIKRVTEYNPYGPRGGGDCSRFKEKYQLAPHISRSKAHDVDDLATELLAIVKTTPDD